jgi:hypothetical protein
MVKSRQKLQKIVGRKSAAFWRLELLCRLLGCIPDNFGFDFCVTTPLGPNAVVRVHSIGDSTFDLLGRGYPTGYVDRKQNYWKELTGAEN